MTQTAQSAFSDANLYAAIHQVLEAERASEGAERRRGQRHAYRCLQLIAPIVGGRLPNQSEFRHVQCDDLSCGGLAYLSDEPAESDELIVALGVVPFVFIKTQVVRQEPIVRGGQSVFRIAGRLLCDLPKAMHAAHPAEGTHPAGQFSRDYLTIPCRRDLEPTRAERRRPFFSFDTRTTDAFLQRASCRCLAGCLCRCADKFPRPGRRHAAAARARRSLDEAPGLDLASFAH